ncbi:GAMYB transcription factor [Parasponia andersonii]|uniref:GAMYB transcription factor n=1 Tax=Parasponia andersonii TaxID=3476 RepID=A0A2P5CH30_PARAD|nr:GAMYB transcription factor [Parasponia andersonii]
METCFFHVFKSGLDSKTAQDGEDELELGVLDGLLDEVEEIEDLHAADGLASPSEDFLLDIGFAAKACGLGFGPCGVSLPRNVSCESQSPGLSGSSNSAVGISESSSVTIQENDSLNKPATYQLPVFRHKRRHKMPVQSIDLHNHNILDDDDEDDPLLSSMLLNRNGKNLGEGSKIGASRREKRLRKPTQRYIEEFSDKKSKYFKGQEKFSAVAAAGMKDKRLKVRSSDEERSMRPGMLSSVPEELSCETKTLVVSEFRARRGRPKKQASTSVPKLKEEVFTSDSDDDDDHRVKRKRSDKHDRRKHQRMWTISEVNKLVDGISEYGVGRWTDIKRLLFTSSAYRTPIDLRDKWRNLLRASSLQKLKKREAEEKQSHALRPLPKSLIRRVRELAKVHPYPRERGQKR